MFKTILVATDGSNHANRAVEVAADMAGRYGAKVILLHVLLRGHMPEGLMEAARVEHVGKKPATGGGTDHLANIPQEIMARVEGKQGTQVPLEVLQFIGKRILSGAEARCRAAGVKEVELVVEEGSPSEIILDFAEKTDADLIVLGSRGLSRLKGILMGSISSQVSHLAQCNCLTVK